MEPATQTIVYIDGNYWGIANGEPGTVIKEYRGYRIVQVKALAGSGPRYAVNITKRKR